MIFENIFVLKFFWFKKDNEGSNEENEKDEDDEHFHLISDFFIFLIKIYF